MPIQYYINKDFLLRKINNKKNNNMKKAIIVLDTLIFECLNNDDLFKHLNDDYFLCLWTSSFRKKEIDKIPYDGYINGLRNGCKSYKYLRMYLRKYHTNVLCLPTIIVDFEKNYKNSSYGYDMCVDIKTIITQQVFNNRDVYVINTKKLFNDIQSFVAQYSVNTLTTVSEESILSKSIVLSSGDIFEQVNKNKQRIINKKCILVVGSSFFSIYHNVDCNVFTEFLNNCYLIVWINNKNVNKQQINYFRTTMKNDNININGMLFGLDRGAKSISFVRKHLYPTTLPFILVDNLTNIYNIENIYESFCDFDYYINLDEFLVNSTFYNMERIIDNIKRFISSLFNKPQDTLKIVEFPDDSSDSEDETVFNLPIHYNASQIEDVDKYPNVYYNGEQNNTLPYCKIEEAPSRRKSILDVAIPNKRRKKNKKF